MNNAETNQAPVGFSLTDITQAIQKYVVAPSTAFGLAGYLFNIEGESIAHLSADITDHYTEDNKAIQDHIAVRPKRITLKGYVGELTHNGQSLAKQLLVTVPQKLIQVAQFLPQITSGATQLQQLYSNPSSITFDTALSQTANIYSLVKNTFGAFGDMSKQQNAYAYFKSLMSSSTLMSIQTPWEYLTNMAIETIVAVQDERTKFITDFAVTFKEIRIAQSTLTALTLAGTGGTLTNEQVIKQNDAAVQAQPLIQKGITAGTSALKNSLTGASDIPILRIFGGLF